MNYIRSLYKYKKLLGINLFFLIIFLSLPTLSLISYRKIRDTANLFLNKSFNPIAEYPVYPDKDKSNKIFIEYESLKNEYRSFIGWRHQKVNKIYTNILGLYNTRLSLGEKLENSSWFFGGSTMWGTGVTDSETIPSIYHEKTKKGVMNFGETSWNSRQSLAQLITLLGDGLYPKSVVFYDGVNDVMIGCRSEVTRIASHARENRVNNAINTSIISRLFTIIKEPYDKIYQKFSIGKYEYNCDKDLSKPKKIAKHLVNNWYTAYLILKDNNSQFYAILQPNIFTSNTPYEYFTKKQRFMMEIREKQFDLVYPLILEEVKNKCLKDNSFCSKFIDGTKWINTESNVFIDFCHLGPEGNKIIVDKLISNLI